jgi:hypothetical protein
VRSNQMHDLQEAFSTLLPPKMTPAEAYRCLVRNQVERRTSMIATSSRRGRPIRWYSR